MAQSKAKLRSFESTTSYLKVGQCSRTVAVLLELNAQYSGLFSGGREQVVRPWFIFKVSREIKDQSILSGTYCRCDVGCGCNSLLIENWKVPLVMSTCTSFLFLKIILYTCTVVYKSGLFLFPIRLLFRSLSLSLVSFFPSFSLHFQLNKSRKASLRTPPPSSSSSLSLTLFLV